MPGLRLSRPLLARIFSRRHALVVWLVLVAEALATVGGWYLGRSVDTNRAQARFRSRVTEIVTAVQDRMRFSAMVLHGAAGLLAASQTVDRSEWHRYYDGLDLEKLAPSIQGLGYSARLSPGELEAHVAAIRTEGFRDYSVRPAGERAEYSAIVFIEPFGGRNLQTLGYDMFSEPVRAAAMNLARSSGKTTMSGKVELAQETETDAQPGFLMYVPVYRTGAPVATEAERIAAHLGWVYSPFRSGDLMNGILGRELPDLRLEIFDGAAPSSDRMLYDSQQGRESAPRDPALSETFGLPLYGSQWALRVSSLPAFESAVAGSKLVYVLVVGVLGGLVIVLLSARIIDARIQATEISQTAALRENEERFRIVVEGSPNGILLAGRSGMLMLVNRQVEELFGYRREELIGRSVDRLLPEEFRRAHSALRVQFATEPTARAMGQGRDLYGQRKDGTRIPIEIGLAPLTMAGNPAVLATVIDISERKRAEQALREAKTQAEAANAAKSEFLAAMSHEIRTPMNGIIGYSTLLLDTDLDAKQREHAATIRDAGQALLTVLNDVLDFSKVEAGKLDFERIDFDPRDVFSGVMDVMKPAATDKGLSLSFTTGPGVPEALRGDPKRLRQVVFNLVGNAVKFTDSGGVTVDLSAVAATPESVRIRAGVRDTGIGMTAEVRGRLFERFYQGEAAISHKYGGAGLGLSISKRLVEAMGGEIGVESAPGVGSLFWFTVDLPRGAQKPTVATVDETLDSAVPARVLVVDDIEMNRRLVAALLTSAGHRVAEAADGASAVAAVTADDYDLVLMDVRMPGMNGYEATAGIRRLPAPKREIPVVAVTASATKHDVDRCHAAGMNDHMSKPIDKTALLRMVDRWHRIGQTTMRRAATTPTTVEGPAGLIDESVLDELESTLGVAGVAGHARLLVDHMGPAIERLRRAYAEADRTGIAHEAHALAGVVGNLGLVRVQMLVREIETELQEDHAPIRGDGARVDRIAAAAAESIARLSARYPQGGLGGAPALRLVS